MYNIPKGVMQWHQHPKKDTGERSYRKPGNLKGMWEVIKSFKTTFYNCTEQLLTIKSPDLLTTHVQTCKNVNPAFVRPTKIESPQGSANTMVKPLWCRALPSLGSTRASRHTHNTSRSARKTQCIHYCFSESSNRSHTVRSSTCERSACSRSVSQWFPGKETNRSLVNF